MTLTSEKTATKRHAWLVGATTAAMAVALIGVGPIAANAAPANPGAAVPVAAGNLALTIANQSTATTPLAVDALTDILDSDANGTPSTITVGSVTYNATVTTKIGNTTQDVTSSFSLAPAATTAGNTVVTVKAATGLSSAAQTDYTLTLTPAAYSSATVNGSVSTSFSVVNGDIYVNDVKTTDTQTATALVLGLVQVNFGTITKNGTPVSATLSGNGITPQTIAGTGAATATVPAGATYNLTTTGTAPTLATGGSPFGSGTNVVPNPTKASVLQTISVPATAKAPLSTGNITAAPWAAPAISPFNDVNSSTQFYNEMSWLSATGISTGYADGGFHPAATIKRNAEAAFLYRLAGSPTVTAKEKAATFAAFSDVTAKTQFSDAIAWLYMNGITTGYADGTFQPASTVTRGAMAAFLYRFVNNTAYDTAADDGVAITAWDAGSSNYAVGTFTDVSRSTQFAGDIAWLSNQGNETNTSANNPGSAITTGYADGSFQAGASIKRNAMAAFIYRLASI